MGLLVNWGEEFEIYRTILKVNRLQHQGPNSISLPLYVSRAKIKSPRKRQ